MSTEDDARPEARLIVLAALSGAGLNAVVRLARARSPRLWLSVPATTRPPRADEIDGEHRVFLDRAAFERLVAEGDLLEWGRYGGHLYGTLYGPVRTRLRSGRPVLVTLDIAGARQVRAAVPTARLVLLAPARARQPQPGQPAGVGDPARAGGAGPDPALGGFDALIVNDRIERAAEHLVGLLGCPFLTPPDHVGAVD